MQHIASDGKLVAPERVHEEINRVGSRGLRDWAKTNKAIFIPHDPEIQTEAMKILYSYEGLIDMTSAEDEADRWVIALAKVKGFSVVTHETSAKLKKKPERSLYIPDVCNAMKIPCIELLELMRREKWTF